MSRVYTITFTSVAVTAQQDLFALVAGSTKSCKLKAVFLSQSSDQGDAQAEGLSIVIKSGQTVAGSGGGTFTPVPLDPGDAACTATARINDTTPAGTGTIVTHYSDNWTIQQAYPLVLPENLQPVLTGSRRLTVSLLTTPADSITVSGSLVFEEFG